MADVTKLQVLGNRVGIKPDDPESVRPSGIIIPEQARKKPQFGTVVALGNGEWKDQMWVQPTGIKLGDRVFYSQYSGVHVDWADEPYVIVPTGDIYAKEV